MKPIKQLPLVILVSITLFSACGGGGLSEEFTKDISTFETAWNNTGTTIQSLLDSLNSGKNQCDARFQALNVPDSLADEMEESQTKKLDSVKAVCQGQNQSLDLLTKNLQDFKLSWDNDTRQFAAWKDKVFKSEIDIETAKKDLTTYKQRLTKASEEVESMSEKMNEVKVACEGNCRHYDQLLQQQPADKNP